MAYTWSLKDTETISGDIAAETRVCSNSDFSKVYFTPDISSSGTIYEWDGATLTDLGFDTWAAANFDNQSLVDIAWFNGNLYAAFNASETGEGIGFRASRVARWSGSIWSQVAELLADDLTERRYLSETNARQKYDYLAADDNRIIAAAAASGFNFGKLFESTDGDTWSIPEISSVQIEGYPFCFGKLKNTRRAVLAMEAQGGTPYSDWRVIDYSSGWQYLSASDIGDRHLKGYLDGKSFFSYQDTNWKLAYSTDWGVNVVNAGGPTFASSSDRDLFRLYDFADDTQLMIHATAATNQVYKWNTGTNQFDADSVPDASDVVYGLFRLKTELIAICENGSNSVTFYTAGGVFPPGFALTHSGGGIPGAIV